MNFTREQIEATWAKYGTGEPLSDEKVEHILRVLNAPVTVPLANEMTGRMQVQTVPIAYLIGVGQPV